MKSFIRIGVVLLGLLILPMITCGQTQVLHSNSFSSGNAGASITIALSLPATTAGTNIKTQVQAGCTTQPMVTDQVGHTFSLDAGVPGAWAFSAGNPTATAAPLITATFPAACSYLAISAEEVQGTSGIDGQPLLYPQIVQKTTAINLGSITTAGTNDFIVSMAIDNYGNGGLTAGTGFMPLLEPASPALAEFEITTGPGSYPVEYTIAQPGYKVTALAIAYVGSSAVQPPPVPQIPVTLSLFLPSGQMPSGTLTLYSDVFNANGTVSRTTVAVWPVTNGAATAMIPAAMSGTYEFDLSGSLNSSIQFQPGVFQQLLNTAGSITANITLDPVTGQPLSPYTFQVLPKSH